MIVEDDKIISEELTHLLETSGYNVITLTNYDNTLEDILKNCIEHSSENSFINIEVIDNKIYKEIIIKDSGEGIDKKDLLHIFERFYKGKNSSKDSVGIGLALAKKIIEMNNGSISVNSVKGKGTIFTIRYY